MKKFKFVLSFLIAAALLTACGQNQPEINSNISDNSSSYSEEFSSAGTNETQAVPYYNEDYDYIMKNPGTVDYITEIVKTRIYDPNIRISEEVVYLSSTYDQMALTVMFATTDSYYGHKIICADFTCENGRYKLYNLNYISQPAVTSSDGRYSIYKHQMGAYVDTYILADNETDIVRYMCEEQATSGDDCGFFKNGDIYVMTQFGLKTFTVENTYIQNKFNTQAYFPCGKNIDENGTHRWLFAIRREPDEQSYIVIYTDYPGDYSVEDRISKFQLKHNYKVGILNRYGTLQKSWDTGIPVVMTQYLNPVYMFKTDENTIEFYVTYKEHEFLRGTFDLNSGIYTSIKDYEAP